MNDAASSMDTANHLRHWRIERHDGIAHLVLDRDDASQNSLSADVIRELDAVISAAMAASPRGVVIRSGKPNNFIVGADVKSFADIDSADEALTLVREAHRIFSRLESLAVPTLAMIEGNCLGGGLELALACRYRVASDADSTRLGLPEVLLGIHPGFGGTARLIERVGPMPGMDMMLTGRGLRAQQARRIGLVDIVAPPRHLVRAAHKLITDKPPVKQPSVTQKALNTALARPLIAKVMRNKVKARARPEHYPAPYALIDLWQQHGSDKPAMLDAEARSISQLIVSPTSRNLVRVFFLQERLKALGKTALDAQTRNLAHVHVIGAGVMGGDIAAWCASKGMQVTLQDLSSEALGAATKRAYAFFKKRLRQKRMITAAMDRFTPDPKGYGVAKADIIIEAVVERLDVKQTIFADLEQRAKPDAVLATNTSSIPLQDISATLNQPERLVGVHFFNPVAKMQLVEIVSSDQTARGEADKATAFTNLIGRLPVPVKSSPGFLVNRILTPYLMEAVMLLEEGVPAIAIDQAATRFGMPMGPIELADTVGLDICQHVAGNLSEAFGGAKSKQLDDLVAAGRLGKKSGRGFYEWSKGKPRKPPLPKDQTLPVDIEDRLILRYLNECIACLREGVVSDQELLDGGMIFGTGFAPFRGGPMHYLRHRGSDYLQERSTNLAQLHGERFMPDPGWQSLSD